MNIEVDNTDLFICTRPLPLSDVRPGICMDEDYNIIFKTEYEEEQNGKYQYICYNEAGERYCDSMDKLVYSIKIGG